MDSENWELVNRFISVVDKSKEIVLIFNSDKRLEYFNPASRCLKAQDAAFEHLDPIVEVLPIESGQLELIWNTTDQKGHWSGEVEVNRSNGTMMWLDCRVHAMRNGEGRDGKWNVVFYANDITDEKKIKQYLHHAHRMDNMGTLVGGIAHDLNNILTPILMSSSLLDKSMCEEDWNDTIQSLRKSSARAKAVVNQLLSISRRQTQTRTWLQPEKLLGNIEEFIRETFPKSIELICRCNPESGGFMGNSTEINQVLLNLCINSMDAMPEGGTLKLEADEEVIDTSFASMVEGASPGKYIVIKVSDSGIGISNEIKNRVFEVGFTTKAGGKGAGLGLSIVKNMIKSHGGFLQLKSKPGLTEVTVYLPSVANSPSDEEEIFTAFHVNGNGKRILFVDDEVEILNNVKSSLQKFGFSVTLSSNGAEAIRILTQYPVNHFQLVMTDLLMPSIDGKILAYVVRQINPSMPIVFSTGGDMDEKEVLDGLNLNDLSIVRVIHKPFTTRELASTIREVLELEAA